MSFAIYSTAKNYFGGQWNSIAFFIIELAIYFAGIALN
jgi:hypothetical protein